MFNVNKISLPSDNKGILADVNIVGFQPGGRLKDNNGLFLFSGGFILSGKSNDFIWSNGVASSSIIEDYQAGNVDSLPGSPDTKFIL
jgi:hypothetical protein